MRKLAFVAVLVAGCSAGSSSGMLIDPGPAPSNGLQIVTPIIHDIEPGTDNELCTFTDVIADHDLYVKAIQGIQTVAGHHIIVYQTKTFEAPNTTRKCTNDDLTEVRYVGGAAGEGVDAKNTAPGNLAFTIQKGYQIVINHHYINASPKAHDVQSAVNLFFTAAGEQVVPMGALAVVDTDLHLPPGLATKDIDCTLQNDVKTWFMIPHMHEYGTTISVDHVTSDGTATRLFDTPWNPTYTFEPPETRMDPSKPVVFAKGDHVKVHCEWNNTASKELTFGLEMCVFFAQTIDDVGQGNLACDAGNWTGF